MPKARRKRERGGMSQHVRHTTFINPFFPPPSANPLVRGSTSRRCITNDKITTVLGPKARDEEIRESDRLMQEQLSSMYSFFSTSFPCSLTNILTDMDAASRQILNDLQTQAGVSSMNDAFNLDTFPDPFSQDDDWFEDPDDQEPPPERINIADAARALRRHL